VAQRFLTGPEFERFLLRNNELTIECGEVALTRSDRTLSLSERKKETLTPLQVAEIKRDAHLLLNRSSSSDGSLPAPGTLSSLSDHGIAELHFVLEGQSSIISTSLESMSDPHSYRAKQLQELFLRLHKAGPKEICGHRTFYNIGAEDNDS
jgi:hypothetical protein